MKGWLGEQVRRFQWDRINYLRLCHFCLPPFHRKHSEELPNQLNIFGRKIHSTFRKKKKNYNISVNQDCTHLQKNIKLQVVQAITL